MEFIPPKIKEKLDKLEEENTSLKNELAQKNLQPAKKSGVVPLTLAVVILFIVLMFQYFKNQKKTTEDIARIRVELWRSGQAVDTSFVPSDSVTYSIQIGAFKNQSISELSSKLDDASIVTKDSLKLLVVGSYTSLPDAQAMLGIVVQLGIENAYIIAQKNGKAVGLLTEQNGE